MRLSKVKIFIGQKYLFLIEKVLKHYSKINLLKNREEKKMPFFDQNHRLTPLKKYAKILPSEVNIFICQKQFFFIEKNLKHYFKIIFAEKQKMKERPILDQNHRLTPLEKYAKMLPSEVHIFIRQRPFFSVEKIPKPYLKIWH